MPSWPGSVEDPRPYPFGHPSGAPWVCAALGALPPGGARRGVEGEGRGALSPGDTRPLAHCRVRRGVEGGAVWCGGPCQGASPLHVLMPDSNSPENLLPAESAGNRRLRRFFRRFNRLMLLLWRLGLGPWVNAWPAVGGRIIVITHTPPPTGRQHQNPHTQQPK